METGTALTGIIRESPHGGDVLGVSVTRGNAGDEVLIRARRGVVLTCGGFAGNGEMMHLHNGKIAATTLPSGSTNNTGDGLVAAQYIGAQTVNMGSIQVDVGMTTTTPSALLSKNKSDNLLASPQIYIEIGPDGNRMWSEMLNNCQYYEAKLTRLAALGGLTSWWKLGDAKSVAAREATEEDMAEFAEKIGHVCDTIDEAAQIIGCDAATLKATVDRYNGFVDAGVDSDYGNSAEYLMMKIDTPPFCLYEVTYCTRTTPGGLRINEKSQVIDIEGAPMPRLYAAGEVTGSVHGKYRNNGGDSWTDIVCFGRIAGDEVVSLDPVA